MSEQSIIADKLPLCVDMDGTLIRSDALIEHAWRHLYRQPFAFIITLFSLFRGLPQFKQQLAKLGGQETMSLPFNDDFVAYLTAQHQQGRQIYLVTASDQVIARQVAARLNLFTDVLASDGSVNLKAKNKANRLVQQFGEKKFVYAGNCSQDIPVWAVAEQVIMVNAAPRLIAKMKKGQQQVKLFDNRKNRLLALMKAIRVHQWTKNLLLFIPLLVGHLYTDVNDFTHTVFAFVSFSLAAASVYLLNDLLDLDTDRQHHSKKDRPLAKGDLPLIDAILLCPWFFVAAIVLAYGAIGFYFLLTLVGYYILAVFYSFLLKKQRLLDIFSLAALYTIRIIAGIVAAAALFSPWLISFSLFFFFSLALVKRYSELYALNSLNKSHMQDKMYSVEDMGTLKIFGVNAGYISVVVMALYINSQAVVALYKQPLWLWGLVVLLLFWITRIWLLASKGGVAEDPVTYTIQDRVSWLIALFSLLFIYMAF